MNHPQKTVFITGASSGIGKACAEIFSSHGYRLVLMARRIEALVQLKARLGGEVHLLSADVRYASEVKAALNQLPEAFKPIDILINNAGLAAGFSEIQDGTIEDWEHMIDTNLKGMLYVTHAVLPEMISRKAGHIINLSSTAAKVPYQKGNVYCATKAAVDMLSQTMRIDLLEHGIKVTNVAPGMVETEFSLVRFKGDAERASNVYKGLEPLKPTDVAQVIYFAASLPSNVCINDLTLTALQQANSVYTHRKS